jgi:hypothetical protein
MGFHTLKLRALALSGAKEMWARTFCKIATPYNFFKIGTLQRYQNPFWLPENEALTTLEKSEDIPWQDKGLIDANRPNSMIY